MRGVAVNPNIIRTVIERNWVRVVGHREVVGHPELLGTTREFLDYFGLKYLDDLPPLAELQAMRGREPAAGPAPRGQRGGGPDAPPQRLLPTATPDETAEDQGYSAEPGATRELVAGPQTWTADGARPCARARRRRRSAPAAAPPRQRAAAEPERLQKVLARAGLASRREAEDWIRAGRLTVNSQPATLGMKVAPSDQVRLDGRLVRAQREHRGARVFICHRSPGEPLRTPDAATHQRGCAPAAPGDARAAAQARRAALHQRKSHAAVDGGLELVTSDGALAEACSAAVHTFSGEFGVRVRGELTEENVESILRRELDSGEHLAVERCDAAGGEAANRWYTLVARGASGKHVRQLFERQGAIVSRVQRVRLGPLALERTLGRSQFRELTQEELDALLAPAAAEGEGEGWASKERPLTP